MTIASSWQAFPQVATAPARAAVNASREADTSLKRASPLIHQVRKPASPPPQLRSTPIQTAKVIAASPATRRFVPSSCGRSIPCTRNCLTACVIDDR